MVVQTASLARAARQFIGVPFRLHGRDPAFGLDCIGLVGAALAAIGRTPVLPATYALRNSDVTRLLEFAAVNGLQECSPPIRSGDVILVEPGPSQHHVLIAEHSGSFIHAHAGLRRVVRMPGPLDWAICRHWRLSIKD